MWTSGRLVPRSPTHPLWWAPAAVSRLRALAGGNDLHSPRAALARATRANPRLVLQRHMHEPPLVRVHRLERRDRPPLRTSAARRRARSPSAPLALSRNPSHRTRRPWGCSSPRTSGAAGARGRATAPVRVRPVEHRAPRPAHSTISIDSRSSISHARSSPPPPRSPERGCGCRLERRGPAARCGGPRPRDDRPLISALGPLLQQHRDARRRRASGHDRRRCPSSSTT